MLTSRSGPAAPGAAALAANLAARGAGVRLAACDTADRASLAGLLAAVPAGDPLTMVVHAAGLSPSAMGSRRWAASFPVQRWIWRWANRRSLP